MNRDTLGCLCSFINEKLCLRSHEFGTHAFGKAKHPVDVLRARIAAPGAAGLRKNRPVARFEPRLAALSAAAADRGRKFKSCRFDPVFTRVSGFSETLVSSIILTFF